MVTLQRQGRIGFYVGAVGEEASVVGASRRDGGGGLDLPLLPRARRPRSCAASRWSPSCCGLLGNGGDPMKGTADALPRGLEAGPLRLHQLAHRHPAHPRRGRRLGRPHQGRPDGLARLPRRRRHQLARLPRRPQLRRGAADPGGLRLPEQRLGHQHRRASGRPPPRPSPRRRPATACGRSGWTATTSWRCTRRPGGPGSWRWPARGRPCSSCVTYRMEGHSTSDDPRVYRPEALLEPWRQEATPSRGSASYLERRGALDDAADDAAAGRGARPAGRPRWPRPRPSAARRRSSQLFEDVYAEPLRQQREQREELEAAVAADPRWPNSRHPDA